MKMKTKKTIITLIALVGALCLPMGAFAADFGAEITAVQTSLGSARASYIEAQADVGKALGVKEETLKKLAEANALKSSTKSKDVNTVNDTTANANKEIEELMKKSGELSAESKALFAKGAEKYAGGLVVQTAQIPIVKAIVDNGNAALKNAKGLEKAKLAKALSPASALASSLPGDVAAAGKTGKMMLDFAKMKNIELPKNATNALGGL